MVTKRVQRFPTHISFGRTLGDRGAEARGHRRGADPPLEEDAKLLVRKLQTQALNRQDIQPPPGTRSCHGQQAQMIAGRRKIGNHLCLDGLVNKVGEDVLGRRLGFGIHEEGGELRSGGRQKTGGRNLGDQGRKG